MYRCPIEDCTYTSDDIFKISLHLKRKHPLVGRGKPLTSLYQRARLGDERSLMLYELYAKRNGQYRKSKTSHTLELIEKGIAIAKEKLKI